MSERQLISSGTPWEPVVGYSRAVRIGNLIEVSGTTAMDGDRLIGQNNIYEQTRFILQKVSQVLEEAGASLQNVVRTRMYVTDISQWQEVGRAHGEVFNDIRPATSMVEVSALIHPDLLVEIEITAVVN
ncbi:enamine deaminase RidA (YjgF/YER057c/UK114 family) [Larkinella arboricola]|uniref:Enamine deaminase RidA (YjgF/YER057c/UK114 family) n=1 Tax=Larkinella arboricola TaxID=643671 RepID=A0A327X7A2_LARAB|nr:RidA family protein [Larkinella arboricola]RAK03020.1 enamine deaminase RidA (YjgF/YER057c/UK114 family) [Larkinella arboricola]